MTGAGLEKGLPENNFHTSEFSKQPEIRPGELKPAWIEGETEQV